MAIHRLRISLSFFLTLVLSSALPGRQIEDRSEPVISIKLGQFGYADPVLTRSLRRRNTLLRHLIAFDSTGKLIVGYIVHERNGLVTRELPAYALHLIKIDPLIQTQIASATIATAALDRNAVLATAHNNILVKTSDSIELLSPDLRVLASKKITSEQGFLWSLIESTDKNVLLVIEPIHDGTKVESLDPKSLEQVTSCNYPLGTDQIKDVSENGDTASTDNRGSNRDIVIRPLCGTTERAKTLPGEGRYPFFLSPDKLLLSGFSRDLRVTSVQGDVLFEDKFGSHDIVDSYAKASSVAGRFAVSVRTLTGGSNFLDIDSHLSKLKIVVYRLSSKEKCVEITMHQTPKYYFDFDFSPDGKTLAVFCDGLIQLYKI